MKRKPLFTLLLLLLLPCTSSADGASVTVVNATWTLVPSSGWFPVITVQIKNESGQPIRSLILKAHFIDAAGIEVDDSVSFVRELDPSRTKEVLIQSSRGYKTDAPFLDMETDEDKWTFDLKIKEDGGADREVVNGRPIELPYEYRKMFGL